MENQQNSSKKVILNYGLILAGISILLHVALYAMGKHLEQDWKTTVLSIALTTVVLVLGIKKFKESNNGFLTLGEGLKVGIGIALVSTVIYIIYTMLFMNVIAPETMDQSLEIAREKLLENPNMSEDQIDAALEMQKKFSSPGILAAVMLVFSLFISFVISLIASLVMQKKEDQY